MAGCAPRTTATHTRLLTRTNPQLSTHPTLVPPGHTGHHSDLEVIWPHSALGTTCVRIRARARARTVTNGAIGFAFMDEDFARHHQFPLIPLKKPRTLLVEVIDRRPIVSGMITHLVHAKLQIRHHMEDAFFFVTRLGHYPLFLGILWLRHYDVNI